MFFITEFFIITFFLFFGRRGSTLSRKMFKSAAADAADAADSRWPSTNQNAGNADVVVATVVVVFVVVVVVVVVVGFALSLDAADARRGEWRRRPERRRAAALIAAAGHRVFTEFYRVSSCLTRFPTEFILISSLGLVQLKSSSNNFEVGLKLGFYRVLLGFPLFVSNSDLI